MALTTTPLGLRKPDGKQLANTGDNDLAFNAQKTEELIQEDRARLESIAAVAGTLVEDPADPGFYLVGGTP